MPHPSCTPGRKRSLAFSFDYFPGHRKGRYTSEPLPCPLLASVSGMSPLAGAEPWGVVRPVTCRFPPWREAQPVLGSLHTVPSPIPLLLRKSLLSFKLLLPLCSPGSKYLSSLKLQSVLACILVGRAASCQTARAHSYLQNFCGFRNLVPQLVGMSSINLYLKSK